MAHNLKQSLGIYPGKKGQFSEQEDFLFTVNYKTKKYGQLTANNWVL